MPTFLKSSSISGRREIFFVLHYIALMISILLPNYNDAKHLSACLDSIIAQSEPDWELIAVDDHSTDDSWEIMSAYAEKDGRIMIFKNENKKGVIGGLQTALSKSMGPLITRMDADDLMPENKLAALKTLILKHGPGHVATGKVKYFSDHGLGEGYKRYENWLNGLMESHRHKEELYKECPLPSPAWMAYRDELLACRAFDPMIYPEDYDLCFRFYEAGIRIIASQEVVHLWRDHPQRTTRATQTYADHTFLDLKIHYFLKISRQLDRPLILWGAGKKGKRAARLLQENQQIFQWVCNTPSKIGKDIYGIRMQSIEQIDYSSSPQLIILVAAPDEQKLILHKLEGEELLPGKDFFFFC